MKIFCCAGRYFLRYHTGCIEAPIRQIEITPEQAVRARQGECEAYEVILETQRPAESA